jgi:hypothetical protein
MRTQNTTTGAGNTTTARKKITLATFKSFIRKNADALFVNEKSSFDGMVDCVTACEGGFAPAEALDKFESHTLGLRGLWLVGGSRDYFKAYEDDKFVGIEVCNCCGRSIVAVAKQPKEHTKATGKIVTLPPQAPSAKFEVDAGEPNNIIKVEFDRNEYVVCLPSEEVAQ